MLITEAVNPTFANHESFHLRYGWLKKAHDQVERDSQVFSRDDSTISLGVGKNMVRSMKFWATACKIICPADTARRSSMELTPIGHALFSRDGLDPYLESPDTLWLIHWLLFSPPCRLPVWWIIMNEITATNVKMADVAEAVMTRVTNIREWKTPNPKSVKKDVDVFARTYTTRRGGLHIEDYLDCPFRQLGMIGQSSGDAMRFVYGRKHGLSPLIAAFACIDFVRISRIASGSVSVSRLASEAGGVGNTFKVNENELADLLREAAGMSRSFGMQNVNGAPHLVCRDADRASDEILGLAYNRRIRIGPIGATVT